MIRVAAQRVCVPHTGGWLRPSIASIASSKAAPRSASTFLAGSSLAYVASTSRRSGAPARLAVTAASTAPGSAAAHPAPATMPSQRQPGEWESPITSELITSAVGAGRGLQAATATPLEPYKAATLLQT